jgi:hypothetical protein
MKKITLALTATLAVLGAVVAPQEAGAQQVTQIQPVQVSRYVKILTTKATGNINVTIPNQLQGLQCSDITLVASSVEMLPPPPGGFATQHKWTRIAHLSGNNLNSCSYTVYVPGNSQFNFSLGADSTQACMLVGGYPTPNGYEKYSVPTNTSKTINFSATMSCQNIY